MYITRTKKTVGSKQYQSVLLVKSVRINGKPRHETILNLSQWSNEQVAALEFALKGKKGIGTLDEVTETTDKGIGGVLVVAHLAKKLGITEALGTTKEARLAMALIAGRLLTQGSRLKLCEWQKMNEVEACLDVPHFSEEMIKYYPAERVEEIYHEKYKRVRAPVIPIDRQQDATMILDYPEGETMSMSGIKYQPSFPCCRKC